MVGTVGAVREGRGAVDVLPGGKAVVPVGIMLGWVMIGGSVEIQ